MAEPSSIPRGPHQRSLSRTIFLWTAAVVSLCVAGGSGLAIAGIHHFENKLPKIQVGRGCEGADCLRDIEPGPCIREACNFLVLGSDTREGLTAEDQQQFGTAERTNGQRADTIIVVQTDVQNERTIVLSIPRDLLVEIPGHGMQKINQALDYGANVMVRTVEKLTGLEINHYVQVDFVGFIELVDALGGVSICVDRPLIDRLSGLKLPHAGCYHLRGHQALAFVRARHIEGDVIPDFSRISRQQQFTRAVINKVLSLGAIFNYIPIVNAASRNLTTDAGLNLYDLQDLTRTLASLGQKTVDFRVVPARPLEADGVSYVEMITGPTGAEALFRRIREGRGLGSIGREAPSTPISPANIEVRVRDANSGGAAERVADYLERAGFIVNAVEPAPPGLTTTKLRYGGGATREANGVGSYLPTIPKLFDNVHTDGREITVVIGPDFEEFPGL
jgi:LCP family protein required for cell wall assembly